MSNLEPTSAAAPVSAFTASTANAPATRAAIEAANARFVAAYREGDAAAVAACYTADAQLLPANSEPVTGTEAIARFWAGVMKMGIADARLETVELEPLGDAAVEVGRYRLAGADGGTLDQGKYMVLWHREGESWKLHRDIWTTSRPAPDA